MKRVNQQWLQDVWKSLLCVGLLATQGCIFDANVCENEILSSHPSPTGQHKALIFQRNCGATTPFSTQISILAVDEELPNQSGNAFSADTDGGAAPSGPGGGPEVKVQWSSATKLLIQHHPAARVFHAPRTVKDIQLSIQPSKNSSGL